MHEAGIERWVCPFTYVPFEVRDLSGALTGMRGARDSRVRRLSAL